MKKAFEIHETLLNEKMCALYFRKRRSHTQKKIWKDGDIAQWHRTCLASMRL